jgi:hypothetical protein
MVVLVQLGIQEVQVDLVVVVVVVVEHLLRQDQESNQHNLEHLVHLDMDLMAVKVSGQFRILVLVAVVLVPMVPMAVVQTEETVVLVERQILLVHQ